MSYTKSFPSGAALQEFLLAEAGPGILVVVPHQRLARQVQQRQRRRESGAGRRAWEPLPLVTLPGWWRDLFDRLWAPVALAPTLVRLSLWQQAMEAGPALTGATPDLNWAQALDEAHDLLTRHLLPTLDPSPDDSPLAAWRRRITRLYTELLREGGGLTPAALPRYLLDALKAGKLSLPSKVLVAGLETPAPAEDAWLQAVAGHTEVLHLQVSGHPQAVAEAVALPDREQETAWVAARLIEEAHREGLPPHRLAVTSPDMDHYAPQLQGALRELLGPAGTDRGWAYNFSRGPTLAETPLFQAALLPLKFLTGGEGREDLVSLLLSPYYGALREQQGRLARWDRLFRENRLEQGWRHFREAVSRQNRSVSAAEPGPGEILDRLDQALAPWKTPQATGGEYLRRLRQTWQVLGFPGQLDDADRGRWASLKALLGEVEVACASRTLKVGEFREWLNHGARSQRLAGPGIQEAGIQALGWLEIRGLDFDRVFCLGMNSGVLPAPPRTLPLLGPHERRQVLGGTHEGQRRFGREWFGHLLAAAPRVILTRPRVVEEEKRVATPFYARGWREQEFAPLSRAHPAWVRSRAVQAALTAGAPAPAVAAAEPPVAVSLPDALYVTRLQTALSCPCRFLLEILLKIRELPEIEAGLPPLERGQMLHRVLARFVRNFGPVLEQAADWPTAQARAALEEAARYHLGALLGDPYWLAEWERWFGDGETIPGLLWAWLALEQERRRQGWRWEGTELTFEGLRHTDWVFAVGGRLDRLDYHPEQQELIVWDYKTGEIPTAGKVFEKLEEFQLPGYLLALIEGRVAAPADAAAFRAGFIGLKSTRKDHLKHQDFLKDADRWEEVVAAWRERVSRLSRRLSGGDYRPEPTPAPEKNNPGACAYCPYPLICGQQLGGSS